MQGSGDVDEVVNSIARGWQDAQASRRMRVPQAIGALLGALKAIRWGLESDGVPRRHPRLLGTWGWFCMVKPAWCGGPGARFGVL